MRDLRGHAGAATVREHAAAAEHDREQMPMALIQKLAKRMCNMDETEMINALQVIKDCQSTEYIMINEHGEVEMDRDMQTDFTLWKLHDFMEQSAKTELPRSASNRQQQQQQQQQGDDRGDMPMEVIMDLANALGNMDETGMNDVLQIVRDCQDVDLTNRHGAVELDIDLLEPVTLWKLYDFVEQRAQTANPTQTPSPMMSSGSQHVTESVAPHRNEPDLVKAEASQPPSSGGFSSQRELLRPASNDHQQQQQQQVDHRGNFPMAFMMDLAKALSRIDPRGTNGTFQIIKDCQNTDCLNERGHRELDFHLLWPVTLWKLYDYTQTYDGTQQTAQTANGVMDESNDSDPESDDSDPESDEF